MRKNKWLLRIELVLLILIAITFCTAAQFRLFSATNVESIALSPVIDTYVTSGKPTQSWSNDRGLWVGFNESQALGIRRTFLKFDLSAIPEGSQIQEASLLLNLGAATTNDTDMRVTAHRVINDWDGSLNWETAAAFQESGEGVDVFVSTALGAYTWVVTNLVNQWLVDPARGQYLSINLKGVEDQGVRQRGFWASECTNAECGTAPNDLRPKLHISFTLPPPATDTPTPTATSTHTPIPTDTPVPTATPTETPLPTATPTPGMALRLENTPPFNVSPGESITYTIHYKVSPPIQSIIITNPIPYGMNLESINNGGELSNDGKAVFWKWSSFTSEQDSSVSYVVRVPERITGLTASSNSPTYVGATTTFTASVQTGSPLTYTWFLREGAQPLLGKTVTYNYDSVGTYPVTVTASSLFEDVTATATVVITDVPISGLQVRSSSPTPLGAGSRFTVTTSAGTSMIYRWNWGDQSPIQTSAISFDRQEIITHTYATTGTFTTIVTATNSVGSMTASTIVSVVKPHNAAQTRLIENPLDLHNESVPVFGVYHEPVTTKLISADDLSTYNSDVKEAPRIVNQGAHASWVYNGSIVTTRSNIVVNNGSFYLPFIQR